MSFITKFLKNESGATAIEYGLIAAFVAVVIIATFPAIKEGLNTNFTNIGSALNEQQD